MRYKILSAPDGTNFFAEDNTGLIVGFVKDSLMVYGDNPMKPEIHRCYVSDADAMAGMKYYLNDLHPHKAVTFTEDRLNMSLHLPGKMQ